MTKLYSQVCAQTQITFGRMIAKIAPHVGAKMTDNSDRTPDYWIIEVSERYWKEWDPLNNTDHAMRIAYKFDMIIDFGLHEIDPSPHLVIRCGPENINLLHGTDALASLREGVLLAAYRKTVRDENAKYEEMRNG